VQVLRRRQFVEDLNEAYAYLAERNPAAADRLLDELEQVVALLFRFPEIGRGRVELRAGIRSFRLRRFRHIIFYRYEGESIVLLRILHGARDVKPPMMRG